MAEFSKIENDLIAKIEDTKLVTSLSQLREAAEIIWSQESPRVIKDYTDHGIQHYERIISFIKILLELNSSTSLNSRELYLLLAGVYMHDIGMQCDILIFPDINIKAIDLGAFYDIEMQATSSNEFIVEEQKQIRKNHQYLSAAWIDYASRSGKTLLGSAAKSIPNDLVDDLMDICLHHSKIPISSCHQTFKYEPNNRKQFVAAILRFADELDIDSSRVNFETVENFRLSPENSIYWYIHNCIKISIKDNLVIILVRLNPNDIKVYEEDIDRIFIKGFESKNKTVLDILVKNGIAIRVGADSKVVEDDRVDEFPDKLKSSFKNLLSAKSKPLNELSEEIKLWLEALNYEVSVIEQPANDRHILKASLNFGTIKQNILIHCVDSEISLINVENIEKELNRDFPDGWIISDTRVSIQAREKSADIKYVRIFNLSEFLTQMVWAPYFNSITSLIEADNIEERYVQPFCYKYRVTIKEELSEVKDSCGYLQEYIESWLNERSKNHLSILGDFGSGKTWFSKYLTYIKLNEYLKDPINKRLPLLITLRDFTKAVTPEQLINDAFIERYNLSFIGSAFNIFQELNKRGKILLILDGFDEMANRVDKQTIIDNFWELAKLVDEKSKVILTSRTEYFRLAKESDKILAGEEKGRATLQLSPPKFEVIYLEEFNDEQIREAIVKQLGEEKGDEIATKVLSIKNLAEMSKKPVLIKLLLSIIEEVDLMILENSAQVYLYATNKLLLRNIDIQRTFTSTKDKVFFLCELAWEMILKNNLNIHYSSIPEIINQFFGDRINDKELDHWDFDLRSQTLLHRNVSGFYKFSHKSIAEFFVAYKFAIELGCILPEYINTYKEKDGKPSEPPYGKKTYSDLGGTFGAISLNDDRLQAVAVFLKNMIIKNESHLWSLYNESKQAENELKSNFTSQNIIYLLLSIDADFSARDLSLLHLENLPFYNTNLLNTDFKNSVLNQCSFFSSNLQGVNFEDAKLVYEGGMPGLSDISGENSFAYLKNNMLVTLGNGKLHFNSIKDTTIHFTLPLPDNYIHSIDSSEDGNTLILSTHNNCYIYDVDNNYELFTLQLNTHYRVPVIFDSKNERFCVFHGDWDSEYNSISVIDISSKKKIIDFTHEHDEIFNVCFGTKSDILIAGGRKGNLLIFDLKEKKLLKTIPQDAIENPKYIYSISLSPDETILVLGTTNRQLTIIDFKTFKIIKKIPTKENGYYLNVKFSNDGKYLLACSMHGVDVFSVLNWEKIFSKNNYSLAKFTPDSNSIILGMSHWNCDIDIFDFKSKQEIYSISHKLDFSKMNIKGLKAPNMYIEFFVERGAKGWYNKEDLESLSDKELTDILTHLNRGIENYEKWKRDKIIQNISEFISYLNN